jgi:hypothetical protein
MLHLEFITGLNAIITHIQTDLCSYKQERVRRETQRAKSNWQQGDDKYFIYVREHRSLYLMIDWTRPS